jgi:hypothetical protein
MEKARVLEELIKKQGLNARSFAEKCGLPYTTVYTILKNGAGKANVNNIIVMCKILGITVEQLDEMSKGIPSSTYEPSYEDVESLIARNGKDFSTEQKMKLIKLLSEID